jgi:hypothetical protein
MTKHIIPQTSPRKKKSPKLYKDKEWLYQQYIIEGKGAPELAELANCHFSTIYYWLEKSGIPKRSLSEAGDILWIDPDKRK